MLYLEHNGVGSATRTQVLESFRHSLAILSHRNHHLVSQLLLPAPAAQASRFHRASQFHRDQVSRFRVGLAFLQEQDLAMVLALLVGLVSQASRLALASRAYLLAQAYLLALHLPLQQVPQYCQSHPQRPFNLDHPYTVVDRHLKAAFNPL